MNYKIDFESIPWEAPIPGVRHRVIKGGGKLLRVVEYGHDMEPHWCEKGHWGYIIDGRMEISFENEVHVYNPGDGVFIPPGGEHRHMGKVLTDTVRAVFVEET
ncbi:MAG: cupin domain-containing protein [Candidatus Zixiibacteriota bacterium]|nr:MAG: cupin domain-containing protein [candidate division Zixibacteria bacterium]